MPSIQDVADQINAKLDSISTNTSNTAQNTLDTVDVANGIRNELVTVNTRLLQLNGTLETGFANLSGGLFALLQVNIAQLSMLDHHRQQHDTMICELTHVNEQLCNVVRKLGRLIELESDELKSIERIEGVFERVHSEAAGDFDREQELHAKIEKCCPPDKPRPEPCPEPCARAEFRPQTPDGLDWKPLDTPQRPDPIG